MLPSSIIGPFSPNSSRRRRGRTERETRRRRRKLLFETLETRRVLASVSGQIAHDFDADGQLEAIEPGLQDWLIYIDSNNDLKFNYTDVNANLRFDDGVDEALEPYDLSDADGDYSLTDLTAGPHVVAQVNQVGWQQTFPPGTGRHTVVVRADQDLVNVNFANQRDFTPFAPGNILVNRSSFVDNDLLIEYTPAGQLVQALVITGSENDSRLIAKDLVLDGQGNLQIFNGYDDVRLTTFDPDTEAFSDTAVPDWDMGRTFSHWGDIAAFGDFVFANEHVDSTGTVDGVIRFNANDLSFERFSDGFGLPTELTVGLDGLLYTLNATHNNTTVHVHDPETMEADRTFNISERLQSLAVDAVGNLYAITDAGLKHFDSDGILVKSTVEANGDDIAISADGKLLLASALRIDITDTNFSSVSSFSLPGDGAVNFLGFAAFVQDPVGESQGGGDGEDFGVFAPGNILVSNSPLTGGDPKLYEYTAFGQLVREFDIPEFEVGGARDLVMDSVAELQIYNGTFEPRLSTFDPHLIPTTLQVRGFESHTEFEGWSTANNKTFGGIASAGNYVFATDVRTNDDTKAERGIVRYDIITDTFERFHSSQGDIIDITVGLDGLLYTLGPTGSAIGTTVHKYHPVTMELLGNIILPVNHRAIAVDANGDIFAVNPNIHRYSSVGVPQGTPLGDEGIGGLSDIDIDRDGRLLIASHDGHILMTDRNFTGLFTFQTRQSDGLNFAAFVSPSRGSPKAQWDTFTVQEDSFNNQLDVLDNDVLQGLGSLYITSFEQPRYGTLQPVGNSAVSYTPPGSFVGVDTFTYTIGGGFGGTDQALATITIEGTANFFAGDDGYSVVEDAVLTVPASSGLLINDGQLDIFPELTPGNILVTHSPIGIGANASLEEYTPTGTLVRSVQLPDFSEGDFADVRDVVLDRNGNVQIYNGTFSPRLTTYDPVANSMTNTQFPDWNTARNVTFGGLAAWRNFVYATDQEVAGDDPNLHEGIVRFDIETGTARRFVDDGDFIDLAVGLDGFLYALGPGSNPTGQYIRVYNPFDMQLSREIQLPSASQYANIRAITVDASGTIYAVQFRDPYISVFNRDGVPLMQRDSRLGAEADFSDIDIHENGRDLLIANINTSNTTNPNDGDIVLTTTALGWFTVLQAPDATSDMKFAGWVQAPVGALNGPIVVSSFTQPSHGTVVVDPLNPNDGSFTYTPDPDYFGEDSFAYVVRNAGGQQRGATAAMNVIPQNDPPILTPASPSDVSDEDKAYSIPLTAIINGGAGTTTISDVDINDPLGGIAVTVADGPGNWAYSTGGSIFVDVGVVTDDHALLLPFDAEIRFTPAGGAGGTATFAYRAWDTTTTEVAGNRVDPTYFVCSLGGTLATATDPQAVPQQWCEVGFAPNQTIYLPDEFVHEAYSEAQDALTITLTDLNDAPVLIPSDPLMGETNEHTTFDIAVDGFVAGVSDPDGGLGVEGIAVVGADGRGAWKYSLNGVDFDPLPAVTDSEALILNADDLLRYTPDLFNGEEATVTYRAWDMMDTSTAGDVVDVSTNGGATAFSAATDSGHLRVTDVNDAPVLTPVSPFLGLTDVITPLVVTLNDFVVGISDVDHDAVIGGIAVTEVLGNGVWAYSRDGLNFTDVAPVSENSALLLHGSNRLRYTPNGVDTETPTITYRAWDATQNETDVTIGGGETAFSEDGDTARLTVKDVNAPPVIGPPATPVNYVETNPANAIAIFPGVTVQDTTSPDFDGGLLTVAILSGGTPNDRLAVGGIGGIQVVGNNVWFDGGLGAKLIGTYSVDGWILDVELVTGEATALAVQSLARAVVYDNVSEDPTADDRLVRLTITDGDGGDDSASVTQTVTVTPVNDAPLAVAEAYQVLSGAVLDVSFLNGVLANDSDFEGDPLTAVLHDPPNGGELVFNSDGSFKYTPYSLFYGPDFFTYAANDGQSNSPIMTVGIDVLLPGTNPAHPADVSGDGFLSPLDPLLVANFVDRNGDGSAPPTQMPPFVEVNGDGQVTTADTEMAADVIDTLGSGQLPPPRLEFPQDPPVLGSGEFVRLRLETTDAGGDPVSTVPSGEQFFLDVLVSDRRFVPEGVFTAYLDVEYDSDRIWLDDTIDFGNEFPRFESGGAAALGLIDEAGAGRITPLADGEEHLLFRVPFTAAARGEALFAGDPADVFPAGQVLLFGIDGPIPDTNVVYEGTSVIITGPPNAADDAYAVAEDGVLEITDIADGLLDNDTDDEGDPLTAVLSSGPSNGSLVLNTDGTFEYTPNGDFFGTDHFTYMANDGFFDSTPATVTIDVTGVDDLPIANDDRYGVLKDGTLTVGAGDGVLANDIDLDQDGLSVSFVQGPDHGNLAVNLNGSFTYTPEPGFGGTDRFTYKASDGTSDSDIAAVDIDVLFDWQNPTHAIDINGDGFASPIDALLVFNEWNRNGQDRLLPTPPVPPEVPPPFYDYNGDGVLSSFDGQAVLEDLDNNGTGQLPQPRLDLPQDPPDLPDGSLVNFRLETSDAAGNARSEFGLGETFYVDVLVEDLRAMAAGVFSAYLDVNYSLAGMANGGPLEYGNRFPNVQAGDTTTLGLVDEVGATQSSSPVDGGELLLVRIPFTGTAVGQHAIVSDAADNLPVGDVTLVGIDGPIPAGRIIYGTTAVTIILADGDGDGVTDREEDDAPNSGDGNSDSTADKQQSHVASLASRVSGRYMTLAASPQTAFQNVQTTDNPSPSDAPTDVGFGLGFFDFELGGIASGGSTFVTLKLESGATANTFYRYGPTPDNLAPHWYPFMFDGTTGAKVYSDRIELHLVDGGRGDDDLATNGTIVGPGGAGLVLRPWQNPVVPEDINNDGSVTPLDALIVIGDINTNTARDLPMIPEGTDCIPPYLDPSGDGRISPLDVLQVISFLNEPAGGEGESASDDLVVDAQTKPSASIDGSSSMFATFDFGSATATSVIASTGPVSSPQQSLAGQSAMEGVAELDTAHRHAPRQSAVSQPNRPSYDDRLSAWLPMDFDLENTISDIAEEISGVWSQSEDASVI